MRHCAILDIGSSKAVCMIVSAMSDGAMIVHGAGVREYSGYRLGELPKKRELAETIANAVHAAERSSKQRIREITVGVPAPFMQVVKSQGRVDITSRNGRVTAQDVETLIDSSLEKEPPEGFTLIHSTPLKFYADRTPVRSSPVGLPCGTLYADVSHCYADNDFIEIITYALDSLGIAADSYVSSALAAACFTVPESIRAGSVFLVDCGGTHTDITLLSGNAVVSAASVPVGGKHITSDLCYGLRLPEGVAEDIKRRYVFSLDYGESCERVRIPNEGVFDIEHSFIQLIIESRADELCELAAEKLDEMAERSVPIFLVGSGMGAIRGAADFVSERTGRRVEISMPKVSRMSSVTFAVALGLADFSLFRLGKSNPIKKTERLIRRTFDWRS